MWVMLALMPFLTQPPEPPRPWLGVTMTPYTEKAAAEGETALRGIRIEDVMPDSAAERAGLRRGDIIVAADDVDFAAATETLVGQLGTAITSRQIGDPLTLTVVREFTVQQAGVNGDLSETADGLARARELLASAPSGAVVEFRGERRRERLTITAELGSRPTALDLLHHVIPPNDAMFPEPVPTLPAEGLVDALVAERGLTDARDNQRNRLAQLVAQPDWYCLSRYAYVMREPFALPELSRRLAAVPPVLPDLLVHAGQWLDLEPAVSSPPALRTGLSPEEHAQQIEALLAEAQRSCAAALDGLNADERAQLAEGVDVMADAICNDVMVQRDTDRARLDKVTALVRLAPRVDRAHFIEAAVRLVALTEPAYLAGLRQDLAGHGPGVFLKRDTEFGPIIFAGEGDTWFQETAAVVIDLGGNDFYTLAAAQRLSVIIDLDGDDEYAATGPHAVGCGLLGVSLLHDADGNDRYRSRRWSQGAGVLGVGILHDCAGDDSYRGGDFTQAAAFCGVGLLIDEAGNDRYDAERFAQAVGLPGGLAALIDRAGNDHYYCMGRDLGAYGTPGIFAGWGQGCGVGLRGLTSGGAALLLDENGDDVYEAGNFSQGGGYYYGWGSLVDRAGDDDYLGSRYGQAFAAHQAIGYLEDEASNDVYRTRRGVGQSCSWDETVTALIDGAGDDVYSGGDFALAASAHNGVAIFVDAAGCDDYATVPGRVRASPNDYHGGASLSLLLDLGGGEDRYAGQTQPNNTITVQPEHGLFADVPGTLDDALARFREWLQPAMP
ncbi:MAG: PDZ domain-containing protein [Phycisphaerae bacterium]|jgi:hypothetical protein